MKNFSLITLLFQELSCENTANVLSQLSILKPAKITTKGRWTEVLCGFKDKIFWTIHGLHILFEFIVAKSIPTHQWTDGGIHRMSRILFTTISIVHGYALLGVFGCEQLSAWPWAPCIILATWVGIWVCSHGNILRLPYLMCDKCQPLLHSPRQCFKWISCTDWNSGSIVGGRLQNSAFYALAFIKAFLLFLLCTACLSEVGISNWHDQL